MNDAPELGIRGPLLLLLADMKCWSCSAILRVGAIAGQADTEAWIDDAEPPRWLPFGEPGAVTHVTAASEGITETLKECLPTLRPAFSRTAEIGYWMNHCSNCDAQTGDFYAHGANGPFFGWPRNGGASISTLDLGYGEIAAEPPYIIPPEFAAPPRKRRTRTDSSDQSTGH